MRKPEQKYAFGILVLYAAFCLVGLFLMPLLSVKLNPEKKINRIQISYSLPNASPRVVEQSVTTPIESILNQLPYISKVTSTSRENSGYVDLEFDKNADAEKVRFQVASAIRYLYPNLPENTSYPRVKLELVGEEAQEVPLLDYTLSGNMSSEALQVFVTQRLRPALSEVKGLKDIRLYGDNQFAYYLTYDVDQIQQLNISESEILHAISSFFEKENLGLIEQEEDGLLKSYNIQLDNFHEDWDWSAILVKNNCGRLVSLTDICTVDYRELPVVQYFRVNAQNALYLRFFAEPDANQIVTAKECRAQLDKFLLTTTDEVSLFCSYDASAYIVDELVKIGWRTLLTLIILLLFVFVISWSWRYTVVIFLSIVANICISFLFYYIFGIEIHLFSLAGIAISLGLIIDNSIVMADHIVNHHNRRVYLAILASTLTTVSALSIIAFLPENLRLNLIDLGLVIIINISVSLVVSLWFIPSVIEKIGLQKRQRARKTRINRVVLKFRAGYGSVIGFCLKWRKSMVLIAVLSFGIPLFLLPEKVESETKWAEVYNKTVNSDFYKNVVRNGLDKYVGGAFRLFYYYVYDGAYFTENTETKLRITTSLPKGYTIEQLNEVMIQMEYYLLKFPEIAQFSTQIYSARYGNIEVLFKPEAVDGAFPYALKSYVIRKSLEFGGASWTISGVGKGFSNQSVGGGQMLQQGIELRGYNYDYLEKIAQEIEVSLKENPRVDEVDINAPLYYSENNRSSSFNFLVNGYDATLYKQNLIALNSVMRQLSGSEYVDYYLDNRKQRIPLVLKSKQSVSFDKWDMFNQPMFINKSLKFNNIGRLTQTKLEAAIHKENQEYIRKVGFRYNGTQKFANRHREKVIAEFEQKLPLGYRISSSKYYSMFQDEEKASVKLLALVAILIFIICATLFESYRQAFVIVFLIPLSFIGVFLVFYLFDLNFDQGGYASFILLSGLTVNASIYLINDYNGIRREKVATYSNLNCYLKSFQRKITPIILTITSSALGLIPFILLGDKEPFWFAFSAGVIGGLVFSLVVLVFFLPVLLIRRRKI